MPENSFRSYESLDLIKIVSEIVIFWKKNQIFEKSIAQREGKPPFVFYEGPPSANGLPGIHHVMARTLKDLFCRYYTLKGYQVKRKAGWDTHGLPIELGVEKELGLKKEDIGKKISIQEYNAHCKKSVMRYTDIWNELTQKIGYWVDLENPYITYDSKYMESLWWLLKELYKKGLLYKSYSIQPYSPAAGTGLSSHELNMPGAYKEISDTSIVGQFKAIKKSLPAVLQNIKEEVYLLAWTTTPWTLPSNTALIVGEKIDYVAVSTYNPYTYLPVCVILAKERLEFAFSKNFVLVENTEKLSELGKEDKQIPYKVLSHFKGKKLLNIQYEQLLPWALPYKDKEKAFRVISADFVSTTDGTGIVHCAPTFGAEDAQAALQNDIPPMLIYTKEGALAPLVDEKGKFVEVLPEGFKGKFVKNEYYPKDEAPEKSLDVEIAILLKKENKAFKVEKYIHSYPHCWRTDKPVLYYPLDSWFIKTTQHKEKMLEFNKAINWYPKSTGEGRFGRWLENLNDWNLSRSRYWGVPLPIWKSKTSDEMLIIGSIEELIGEIQKSIKKGLMKENPFKDFLLGDMSKENYQKVDLHKHIVDKIILVSQKGEPMYRESDLIDVWFDSGAMPYASKHYPFENKKLIEEKTSFPADFIAEGVDQTRGWFFTLHALSTMLFDSVAYKNVISNGLVLDKEGQKMSKSKGNAINPFEVLEKFGPDATRWYMISNAQPWENLRFDVEGIDEVKRKVFGTLYNTYSFFALYANIDHFKFEGKLVPLQQRSYLDKWILSCLHSLIKKVNEYYSTYDATRALRALAHFIIEELSNWYVRLSRRVFWKGEYTKDKIAAYQTLYECLIEVAKMMSPASPFFAEQLYRDLNKVTKKESFESVHLSDFPDSNPEFIDKKLEENMGVVQKITSIALSIRKKEKIKVRQPLSKLFILSQKENFLESLTNEELISLLKQEINIKEIEISREEKNKELWNKTIKANYKALGAKLGKKVGKIAEIIKNFSQKDIEKFEKEGHFTLQLEAEKINLNLEEVEIKKESSKNWAIYQEKDFSIALDLKITPKLEKEAIARELINRIQNLRKQEGLKVTDKIILEIKASDYIIFAIEENKNYICEEALVVELILGSSMEEEKNLIFIENHKLNLSLNKTT